MAARRKAPRRRARKSFNVSAIELGTALSLSQSSGLSESVKKEEGWFREKIGRIKREDHSYP